MLDEETIARRTKPTCAIALSQGICAPHHSVVEDNKSQLRDNTRARINIYICTVLSKSGYSSLTVLKRLKRGFRLALSALLLLCKVARHRRGLSGRITGETYTRARERLRFARLSRRSLSLSLSLVSLVSPNTPRQG